METWGELAAAARADGIGQVAADAVVMADGGGVLLLQSEANGGWTAPSVAGAGPDGGSVAADLRAEVLAASGLALGPLTGPEAAYDTRSADGGSAAVVRHYLYRAAAPEPGLGDLHLDRSRYRFGGFAAWPSPSRPLADGALADALDALLRTAEGRAAREALFVEVPGGRAEVVAGAVDYGHFTLLLATGPEALAAAVVPEDGRIAAGAGGAVVAVPTAAYSQEEAVFRVALCTGPQEGPGAPWTPLGAVPVHLDPVCGVILASTVHGALLTVPVGADAARRHTLAVWRLARPDGAQGDLFDVRLWPDYPISTQ
ncbi:hypothetical protein [Kitasatospora sp. NPDC088783]|uniref:hypothetical protein n=1 Tax=Kitasatospora sp. NPDC088783 TaxID=3364077 RepID=UPI00381A4D1A